MNDRDSRPGSTPDDAADVAPLPLSVARGERAVPALRDAVQVLQPPAVPRGALAVRALPGLALGIVSDLAGARAAVSVAVALAGYALTVAALAWQNRHRAQGDEAQLVSLAGRFDVLHATRADLPPSASSTLEQLRDVLSRLLPRLPSARRQRVLTGEELDDVLHLLGVDLPDAIGRYRAAAQRAGEPAELLLHAQLDAVLARLRQIEAVLPREPR